MLGAALLLIIQIYPLSQRLKQGSGKAHDHVMLFESVLENVVSDFSMVETSLPAGSKKESVVTNDKRTYDAFLVDGTRLYVTDQQTKQIFEIQGLPLEWRPYSDLFWKNDHTLVFDRWSQPHYGVHYAVDVKSRKLVIANPFPDQVYMNRHRRKAR
jgi:hypothetical protein